MAGTVDVVIIVVTYNSAGDIETLLDSLREDSVGLRSRVLVVDNDSTDGTVALLSRRDDVALIPSGGNLGYAGGINAARRHVGDARAVLVLNPDLTVRPGAIRALLARMESSGAGVVVPRIEDEAGTGQPSLRREPSVLRTLGDALLGDRLRGRPGWLSEIDYSPEAYRSAHRATWATGAALLVRGSLERDLGDWDERYFLYSEETDYFRRAREHGATIWFEPAAVVQHRQGGSGGSAGQSALLAVNRVRYAEAHGSGLHARFIHAAVLLHAVLRANQPAHRYALRILADRRLWTGLPQATRTADSELPRG